MNIDSLTLAPATGPRLSATEKSSCEEKSKDHQRSHPGRCFLSLFLSERKITLLYVSVQRAVRKEDQRSLFGRKCEAGDAGIAKDRLTPWHHMQPTSSDSGWRGCQAAIMGARKGQRAMVYVGQVTACLLV